MAVGQATSWRSRPGCGAPTRPRVEGGERATPSLSKHLPAHTTPSCPSASHGNGPTAETAVAPQAKTPAPQCMPSPRAWLVSSVLALLFPLLSLAADTPTTQPARFETINIYVDSGDHSLAAWQVELKATQGDVKIVGIEGGDHRDLYHDPPYYDPKALTTGSRIILASYTTANTAPKGKTLVARVHLRVAGDYRLGIIPMAAADPASQSIATTASVAKAPTTNTVKDKE